MMLNRETKEPDSVGFIGKLKAEADRALRGGDRERCIYLISKIYRILDNKLAPVEQDGEPQSVRSSIA
jgi:hypothetical protein